MLFSPDAYVWPILTESAFFVGQKNEPPMSGRGFYVRH